MTTQQKIIAVNWDKIQLLSKSLASQLAPSGPWQAVVGVARGGLIPATIVARELGVLMVDTVCVSTHNDEGARQSTKFLKILPGNGEGCLVIDDLVDTGTTFSLLRPYLPRATFASLFAKPEGIKSTDFCVEKIDQDVWIKFPWEE